MNDKNDSKEAPEECGLLTSGRSGGCSACGLGEWHDGIHVLGMELFVQGIVLPGFKNRVSYKQLDMDGYASGK
jgi:hypothetical protein